MAGSKERDWSLSKGRAAGMAWDGLTIQTLDSPFRTVLSNLWRRDSTSCTQQDSLLRHPLRRSGGYRSGRVDSNHRRNTGWLRVVVQEPSKVLRGGVVVEVLPRPVVEAGCNIREVLGSVYGQVRVFGKVLAQ